MDGSRTVDALWHDACERLGDAAPTQDEMISLLAQLHAADVLVADVSPDTGEILSRSQRQRRRTTMTRWLSPFAVQFPLVDPDRWLRRLAPRLRPLLGWGGVALWLALVLPALVLAGVHFRQLSEGIFDRALAPGNLVLLWLLFPLIKTIHELGHAVHGATWLTGTVFGNMMGRHWNRWNYSLPKAARKLSGSSITSSTKATAP